MLQCPSHDFSRCRKRDRLPSKSDLMLKLAGKSLHKFSESRIKTR